MIRVVIWQGAEGAITGFRVSGHAGYRPKGEDIVCAAVSALAQTAVISLAEQVEGQPRVNIQEGNLECHLPAGLSQAGQEKARVILRTIALGLEAIARDYRQYVVVEYNYMPDSQA